MLRISVQLLAITCLISAAVVSAAERQSIPIERLPVPVERGRMSTERQPVPVERGSMPTERQRIPTERGRMPTERQPVPVERGHIPVERQSVPVERGHIPTERGANAEVDKSKAGACLIEGSFSLFGKKTEILDCIQNDGVTHAQLVERCESTVKVGSAIGIKLSSMTYMAKCPANPQGICKNMTGGKFSGYYYKRSAKDMVGTKDSCIKAGGTWADS